ncbi:uncharacterized protein LOC143858895 [Tasmannia lanceolata]|uniref:uncharacterized protein LOC143858895 n=1 Tax=Tasmannia lanceolata TaxID=3420 RepID=UPI004063069A
MATSAEGSYEGGIGGKFRRRPFRKPSTPYDRPPIALRNPNETVRNGWISKLVEPASKIITQSASRFFSSVFRPRLPAPPPISGANLEPRHELPGPISINPSSGAQERGSNEGGNPSNKLDKSGINELEQLLKQKTFTRIESDCLTELLRSRTVDLSPDVEKKRTDPSTLQPRTTRVGQEKATTLTLENEIGSCRLLGSISTPVVGLSVPEEVASPAELAKAYMDNRPSKVSPTTIGFRGQTFREDANMLNIVPFAPRSAGENGFRTPIPRGRSAIYNMARSPYSRVNPTTTLKVAEATVNGHTASSTYSQRRLANNMPSGSNQVLKRRSSVLDNDIGSVGLIRRTRQKSNLMSESKDFNISVRGSPLSIPLTPVISGALQGSISSIQKPVPLDESKNVTSHLRATEDRISTAAFSSVPPQSSEMARKILQHLDKLVPSPKEKSSEFKLAMARDRSPTKLTRNMLHGRALRSMDDIESPKLPNVQRSDSLDGLNGIPILGSGNSISQKKDRVEENGSIKTTDVGLTSVSKADHMENAIVSVKDTVSGMRPVDSVGFGFAPNLPRNKRGFQMSAPEDSLELDDDSYSRITASIPPAAEKEKTDSSVFGNKTVDTQAVSVEKAFSSDNNRASSSKLNKEAEMTTRDFDGPIVSEKAAGFTFAVTSAPTIASPQPPIPTVQSSSLFHRSVLSKDQIGAPVFSFGSKSVNKGPTFTFSSTSNSFSDTSGLKFGTRLGSKSEIVSSNATAATTSAATPPDASGSEKGNKSLKAGDSYGSFGNAVSSGVTSTTQPNLFAFGASTNSSLSNGSLPSTTSSAFSVSDPTAAPSSTITSTPLILSVGPTSPTVPILNFKSVTSTAPTPSNSISLPPVTSGSELTGSKPNNMQASSFSITGSLPANTRGGLFGFSASAPSNTTISSSTNNQSQSSPLFGSTAVSLFGTQAALAGSGIMPLTQSSTVSQLGSSSSSSSTFGLSGSSSFTPATSPFGSSTPVAKLFGSDSGFGVSSSAPLSAGNGASTPAVTSTSLFGSSSQPATSSLFGTGFGSTSGAPFSFGGSLTATTGSAASAPFTFGGVSTSATGSAPFMFGSSRGASSGSMFSFTSAAAVTSSGSTPAQPVFGMSNPVGFGLASPGNDQMNVEDSMAEDTVQASMPVAPPAFSQQPSSPSPSNFMFGSATASGPSVFQFGGQQNPATLQSPSPFTPPGNLGFTPGGSFSLGSGGTDKSNRRFVKVKRDKVRRK